MASTPARVSRLAHLPRRVGAVGLVGASFVVLGLAACTPKIGDSCKVSTDCSSRGDRLCDTSQPGGYCTLLDCRGGSCADESSCVLFGSAVPGCGFDDRSGSYGSRVARSFCMAKCESDGDCRDGYVCADPRSYPWNAVILDNDQGKRSCLPVPVEGQDASASTVDASASVCQVVPAEPRPIDASPPHIDDGGANVPPLFPDAATNPADAGSDASDGG